MILTYAEFAQYNESVEILGTDKQYHDVWVPKTGTGHKKSQKGMWGRGQHKHLVNDDNRKEHLGDGATSTASKMPPLLPTKTTASNDNCHQG